MLLFYIVISFPAAAPVDNSHCNCVQISTSVLPAMGVASKLAPTQRARTIAAANVAML